MTWLEAITMGRDRLTASEGASIKSQQTAIARGWGWLRLNDFDNEKGNFITLWSQLPLVAMFPVFFLDLDFLDAPAKCLRQSGRRGHVEQNNKTQSATAHDVHPVFFP